MDIKWPQRVAKQQQNKTKKITKKQHKNYWNDQNRDKRHTDISFMGTIYRSLSNIFGPVFF